MAEDHYRFWGSRDLADLMLTLARVRHLALAKGREDISLLVARLLLRLEGELANLSARGVRLADEAIRGRLQATQRRPDTHKPVHLRDLIHSIPGPLVGTVEVAQLSELDKAVNPEGGSDKSYWRAQEYGLSEGFVGRLLYGSFTDDAPRAKYSRLFGSEEPPSSEFTFGQAPLGPGRIASPIHKRHFLRDGEAAAFAEYQALVAALNTRYARDLAGLLGLL